MHIGLSVKFPVLFLYLQDNHHPSLRKDGEKKISSLFAVKSSPKDSFGGESTRQGKSILTSGSRCVHLLTGTYKSPPKQSPLCPARRLKYFYHTGKSR
jgi:hypothetical protein